MSATRRVVAFLVVGLAGVAGLSAPFARPSLAAEPCGTGATSLENGGFETPGIAADSWSYFIEADVPPWRTTDGAGLIELWGDGYLGFPAPEGTSYAELNAVTAGTLYQDIVTTPGATMTWTLQHRAREGEDVMRVLIGDAQAADVYSDAGWDSISPDLRDDTTAWGEHSGTYVVPAGQTCTRFAFRAVSTGSGDGSMGNLLDDIEFAISIPAPPTASPSSAAATTRPHVTPPPTDTIVRSGSSGGSSPLALAIVVLALGTVAGGGIARRRPLHR